MPGLSDHGRVPAGASSAGRLTRELLTAAEAEAAGRQRQADNHRKVLISLDKIVASLEALRPDEDDQHD